MTDFDINRRRLLAALGGTGVAALGGLGLATNDAVEYTYASSHSCDDYTLNAEWRETYTRDGETTLLEDTTPDNEGTEEDEPAVIHLQNVLPGDEGTVSFELTADKKTDSADDNFNPTLSLDLTGRAENEIIDPEGEAGDTTSGDQEGELQEYLYVKIWEDRGILGVDTFGGNNIVHEPGEPLLAERQTFESVDGLEKDLTRIDATDDSSSVPVTLRWEFPDDPGVNVTQTDSVTFTFDIGCN